MMVLNWIPASRTLCFVALLVPKSLQDNAKLRKEMDAMQKKMDALANKRSDSKVTPRATRPAPSPASATSRKSPPNPKVKAKSKSRASAAEADEEEEAEPESGSDGSEGSEEGLSEAAKKQRLRRLCERKGSGKLLVPLEVHEMWLKGGHTRDELATVLEEAGFDKEWS